MNSESGREARAPEGPSTLDLLRRWKQINSESGPEARAPEPAPPTNSGQARGTGREQKATNSRRKEKRRRRANSLSLRRSG